jgi:hypothetical protein
VSKLKALIKKPSSFGQNTNRFLAVRGSGVWQLTRKE